ncbi:hypothetical protein NP590_07595 [Methylomonas sp. SURF-2]|uniref:HEAT repeat domain-containing protein n=1 Tax=Methylomonas subterranea TaxID=2952225 RepID=A0ABT1TES1_9GAMM|nr:hypothetical protein [Methylomonas sp. SURF-2]MCQ8103963.1 hypothetical protein [Methylomonas sp. SURF-2]
MRPALTLAFLAGLLPQTMQAEEAPNVTVRLDPEARIWQLQAHSAPLSSILDELQRASGMTVHYSVLPRAPVTATCAGENLPGLLKCLLGESAGLVFGRADKTEPREVWILGSSAAGPVSECAAPAPVVPQAQSEPDAADLRDEVRNADPRRRAEALYAMAASDDDDAEASLRAGMSDASALVRGQAIGGWVRRYGAEAAEGELQQALADEDAAVRLQAIELTVNQAILNRGLLDSDATVRQLARAKLEETLH